jgi:hypothetical protein
MALPVSEPSFARLSLPHASDIRRAGLRELIVQEALRTGSFAEGASANLSVLRASAVNRVLDGVQ